MISFDYHRNKDELSPVVMLGLALLTGIIAGFGAVAFRLMISIVHNFAFFGIFNWHYNTNLHTPISPFGAWIILVPVAGAIIVTWIIKTFAPEAKGHGVPEVIDAIYYQQGRIRPIVVVAKSIASAISIGTGGSVGREGPIIQIGSAFGSTLGQIIKMPVYQRVILVAAGAAGAIAATFNAPVGGIAFAVELLLVSISASSIAVVAISTVTATYIGRYFLGIYPAFHIPALILPHFHLLNPAMLLLSIPFGALIGLASSLFIVTIYAFEDWFDKLPISQYARAALGMLIVGIMLYVFMRFAQHYYVQGVGYATIQDILQNLLLSPWLLLFLFFGKLLATSLTLGSGGSGGIFSPALFLGAALGALTSIVFQHIFPGIPINGVAFAIAGMAGMVAGVTGAVLTAITMLYEMTRDYSVMLPVILTVVMAYGVRRIFSKESIYNVKLIRRGRVIHEGLQSAITAAYQAKNIMSCDFSVVPIDMTLEEWLEKHEEQAALTLIEDNNHIVGVFRGVKYHYDKSAKLGSLMDSHFIVVPPKMTSTKILTRMRRHGCDIVLVSKTPSVLIKDSIVGVITPLELTAMFSQAAELQV